MSISDREYFRRVVDETWDCPKTNADDSKETLAGAV